MNTRPERGLPPALAVQLVTQEQLLHQTAALVVRLRTLSYALRISPPMEVGPASEETPLDAQLLARLADNLLGQGAQVDALRVCVEQLESALTGSMDDTTQAGGR